MKVRALREHPQRESAPRFQIRKAQERGHFDHGWLNTYHTFSFADYFDPQFMGFRTLRVINEDRVAPNEGFPQHGHRDMEIITYVIEGALAHKDSMGNGSTILPGEIQRMSAGTGVFHSEYNASETELLHLLQIWILPEKKGLNPSYEQKKFSAEERDGQLRLVGSRDGRQDSVTIHQDVNLYSAILRPGETIVDRLAENRYGWIQIVKGVITLNHELLGAGDGGSLLGGGTIELKAPDHGEPAELLFFDMG